MLFHTIKKIAAYIAISFIFLFPQNTNAQSLPSLNPLESYKNGTQAQLREQLNRKPLLEIRIPGLTFSNITSSSEQGGTYLYISWIPELITTLYKFSIAIVSIVAAVIILVQGVRIITSSGNSETTGEGYKKIGQAIVGLFIAWGSFIILYTVNPQLVEFNPIRVKIVERQEFDVSPSYEEETELINMPNTGNVPYFGQYDRRWAQLKPGDLPEWPFDTTQCNKLGTIQSRGCGPSSLAMVLAYLGKDVTVTQAAKFSLGCSGAMSTSLVQKSWQQSPWSDLKFEAYVNKNRALELAAQNIPIIMNCHPCVGSTGDGRTKTYPGHYMVITGSDDGGKTFNIHDPGGNPNMNRAIIKMTKDQILSPQKDPAIQGCNFYTKPSEISECTNKIELRTPSFIYIHK
jgi:hypothetical protein